MMSYDLFIAAGFYAGILALWGFLDVVVTKLRKNK